MDLGPAEALRQTLHFLTLTSLRNAAAPASELACAGAALPRAFRNAAAASRIKSFRPENQL
jgi:hypothetical protein